MTESAKNVIPIAAGMPSATRRGVVVGRSESGLPLVSCAGFEHSEEAQVTYPIDGALIDLCIDEGREVLVHRYPDVGLVIVGVLQPVATLAPGAHEAPIWREGQDVVVEGGESLEVRCGDAKLRMTEKGNVKLRGTNVTTQAKRTHRIRGGTVAIN